MCLLSVLYTDNFLVPVFLKSAHVLSLDTARRWFPSLLNAIWVTVSWQPESEATIFFVSTSQSKILATSALAAFMGTIKKKKANSPQISHRIKTSVTPSINMWRTLLFFNNKSLNINKFIVSKLWINGISHYKKKIIFFLTLSLCHIRNPWKDWKLLHIPATGVFFSISNTIKIISQCLFSTYCLVKPLHWSYLDV